LYGVKHINSHEEYKQSVASDKLVVVDFYATWCGPCKRISPFLEEQSDKFLNVNFLKVDVDEQEAVAKEEEITAMPTFYFYKGGKKVDSLVGASTEQLLALIQKHQ